MKGITAKYEILLTKKMHSEWKIIFYVTTFQLQCSVPDEAVFKPRKHNDK
jgi:hypothetical protein